MCPQKSHVVVVSKTQMHFMNKTTLIVCRHVSHMGNLLSDNRLLNSYASSIILDLLVYTGRWEGDGDESE